jgi:hypothetical protein
MRSAARVDLRAADLPGWRETRERSGVRAGGGVCQESRLNGIVTAEYGLWSVSRRLGGELVLRDELV